MFLSLLLPSLFYFNPAFLLVNVLYLFIFIFSLLLSLHSFNPSLFTSKHITFSTHFSGPPLLQGGPSRIHIFFITRKVYFWNYVRRTSEQSNTSMWRFLGVIECSSHYRKICWT